MLSFSCIVHLRFLAPPSTTTRRVLAMNIVLFTNGDLLLRRPASVYVPSSCHSVADVTARIRSSAAGATSLNELSGFSGTQHLFTLSGVPILTVKQLEIHSKIIACTDDFCLPRAISSNDRVSLTTASTVPTSCVDPLVRATSKPRSLMPPVVEKPVRRKIISPELESVFLCPLKPGSQLAPTQPPIQPLFSVPAQQPPMPLSVPTKQPCDNREVQAAVPQSSSRFVHVAVEERARSNDAQQGATEENFVRVPKGKAECLGVEGSSCTADTPPPGAVNVPDQAVSAPREPVGPKRTNGFSTRQRAESIEKQLPIEAVLQEATASTTVQQRSPIPPPPSDSSPNDPVASEPRPSLPHEGVRLDCGDHPSLSRAFAFDIELLLSEHFPCSLPDLVFTSSLVRELSSIVLAPPGIPKPKTLDSLRQMKNVLSLDNHVRLCIAGPGGSGKTTTLRFAAQEFVVPHLSQLQTLLIPICWSAFVSRSSQDIGVMFCNWIQHVTDCLVACVPILRAVHSPLLSFWKRLVSQRTFPHLPGAVTECVAVASRARWGALAMQLQRDFLSGDWEAFLSRAFCDLLQLFVESFGLRSVWCIFDDVDALSAVELVDSKGDNKRLLNAQNALGSLFSSSNVSFIVTSSVDAAQSGGDAVADCATLSLIGLVTPADCSAAHLPHILRCDHKDYDLSVFGGCPAYLAKCVSFIQELANAGIRPNIDDVLNVVNSERITPLLDKFQSLNFGQTRNRT